MAAKLFLSLAAIPGAFAGTSSANTNLNAGASHRMRLLHERSAEHQQHMTSLMSNMTTTKALDIVGEKVQQHPEVMSVIQQTFKGQKHQGRSLRAGQPDLTGTDKARMFLNQMIEEVNVKYDLEVQKCCDYDEMQSTLMEEARQDISMFNAEAAEARSEVLQAESIIEMCEIKLPELSDALETHNYECHMQITELERLLKIVRDDLDVMNLLLSLINCQTSTTMLVQKCTDQCGDAFYQFNHSDVKHAVDKLKSDAAKQLLQDHLAELMEEKTGMSNETTTPFAKAEVHEQHAKRNAPCKLPIAPDKRVGKCSIDTSTNCPVIEEKFEYIKAGILDKEGELERQLHGITEHCDFVRANLESQIADFEHKLKDAQTALAYSTKKQNDAEENSRLKSVELKSLQMDYKEWTDRCHNNYEAMESETCGLRKIRSELYKLAGDPDPKIFQDCVVGDWVPGECSASCAGGWGTFTRKVLTEPSGGAKCPVLTARAPCNLHKCPIDCKLEEWGAWSGCTAKCGGGVMSHNRGIVVEPMHGGEPCGETSESISCNIQACDRDCVLADWTPWSGCSKECDGGSIERVRNILLPTVGAGECPDRDGEQRLQRKPCNMFACEPPPGEIMVRCNSTIDVVLLIDGSGSLGQAGWDASVKAGAMLARAFGGSKTGAVKLAVIRFSRHAEVIKHFTDDGEAAAAAIEAMTWPRSLTYTSKALNLAAEELSLGRDDANSIVIVITDGRPMSPWNTWIASNRLRKQARLMFVPVTRWAPLDIIMHCASQPVDENIVAIPDFHALEEPEILGHIIADACPHVI